MSRNIFSQYKYQIGGIIIGSFIIYIISNLVINQALSEIKNSLDASITESNNTILEYESLQLKRQRLPLTEELIPTCSNQNQSEFDDFLVRLDSGLKSADLSKLQTLIESCGYASVRQERHLQSLISLELKQIDILASLRQSISNIDEVKNKIGDIRIRQIARQEANNLNYELVEIQQAIVAELLNNQSIESEQIQALLETASEVKAKQASTR
jgi:hypothetical protein